MKLTLIEGLDSAAQGWAAHCIRRGYSPDHVRAAIAHHKRRGLRCDTVTGTVFDRCGVRAQFVAWEESDASAYIDAPHLAFWDFLAPDLMNSVSRIQRGFKP